MTAQENHLTKERMVAAFIVLSTFAMFCPAVARSDEPSARRQEWVEIPVTQNRVVRALVAYPDSATPATVVVVLHEDRGLTNWERGIVDRLAARGYVAIAPDLLSDVASKGGGTDSFETTAAAREAVYQLKPDQVAADIDAVCAFARKAPEGNQRIAVAGFCWGGARAFEYATHNPEVAATLVFYGAAPGVDQMKNIHTPVHGFYGENDTRVTGDLNKVKTQMKDTGKVFQAVTYSGAAHGFLRTGAAKDARPADRKAHDEAWARLTLILDGLTATSP